MTAPYTAPVDQYTTALLDLLALSARTIYDGTFGGDPAAPVFPYGILFSIPGGHADPLPDLDLDLRPVTAAWQVSAVSNFRNQAEATARLFRDLLFARGPSGWANPLTDVDGWAVIDRRPDPAMGGAIRGGETPVAIYSSPVRFTLTICPA